MWASLIFFLSHQSTLPSPDVFQLDFLFKKTAHMVVYAVLYLLLWRATWLIIHPGHTKIQWTAPLILTFVYAMADELHQSLVPGRSPTIRDLGYDSLGMIVAMLWWYRYI